MQKKCSQQTVIFKRLFSTTLDHAYSSSINTPPSPLTVAYLSTQWGTCVLCMSVQENISLLTIAVLLQESSLLLKTGCQLQASHAISLRDHQEKFLSIWSTYWICQMWCWYYHFVLLCFRKVSFLILKMNGNLWGINWLTQLTSIQKA